MVSVIMLFAALSTAVAAQVGRRYPYGIYPSSSIKASFTSSSVKISFGSYATSAYLVNATSSDVSLPTNTSTPTLNTTTSATFLTSAVSRPPWSWTPRSNRTCFFDSLTTLTASTTSAFTDYAAALPIGAVLPRTTCVSVTIGDVAARGACGCDYNIHTCLERLSNLSEWSNLQTTESFGGCMEACDSEPNCFSFTWQISNAVCRTFGGMLNGGAGVISEADFISGEVVMRSCPGSCSGQ